MAGDLVDKQRARHAARLQHARNGDVIGHHHHFNFPAKRPGFFRRKAEVQPVAGIVLDDEQTAALAGDRENARQYGVDTRRRKNFAAHRRGEHAAPHEPRMGRLMARTATRDDGNA